MFALGLAIMLVVMWLIRYLMKPRDRRINTSNRYGDYVYERREARRRARSRQQEAAEKQTLAESGITYRPARLDELPEALAMFEAAAEALRQKGIAQWQQWLNPTQHYVDWAKRGFERGEYHFIEKNGQIAGMFRLMFSDEEYWGAQEIPAGYVHSLATKAAFKGQNVGATVLKMLEAHLIDKGIFLMRLDCHADNAKLIQYYVSQGFKPVRLQQMPHYTVQLFEKRLPYDRFTQK